MPDLEIDSKKLNAKSIPMSNAHKNHDLALKIKGNMPLFWSSSTRYTSSLFYIVTFGKFYVKREEKNTKSYPIFYILKLNN